MMAKVCFEYRDGVLHAESVALPRLADEFRTPLYVYSVAALENAFGQFSNAFEGQDTLIAYSVKANSNQSVIGVLSGLGAGADVVSEGELKRALLAGVPGNRIVFSGVGKTEAELAAAVRAGVHQFNLESEAQLRLLSDVAQQIGREARIAIRVNPDVDAGTHDKIATGRKADKFGVPIDMGCKLYQIAAALPAIKVVGVDLHIGSQLTELSPFGAAFMRLADLIKQLTDLGHQISQIDIGGGLGVCYENEQPPSADDYARLVKETLGHFGCQIILEPGRVLVAGSGILLCRVIEVKKTLDNRFIIVDAAMNDLLRPALYDAWHSIEPVMQADKGSYSELVDIVGPVCESGDILGRERKLPPLSSGDLLAIRSAGAYGAVMSSSYNTRPPAAEVLVHESKFSVIRPRLELDALIGLDCVPDWLSVADDIIGEDR